MCDTTYAVTGTGCLPCVGLIAYIVHVLIIYCQFYAHVAGPFLFRTIKLINVFLILSHTVCDGWAGPDCYVDLCLLPLLYAYLLFF